MMMTLTGAAWVVARICLVVMFPFSAAEKIWHWNNAIEQTRSAPVPFARPLLVLATLVEFVTPFMIVFGWWDRPAALALAGFCVVTAVLYHPFWKGPDLFGPSADSKARAHFWEFVKNFGLVGGLLLVVFAGTLSAPGANWWTWLWSR